MLTVALGSLQGGQRSLEDKVYLKSSASTAAPLPAWGKRREGSDIRFNRKQNRNGSCDPERCPKMEPSQQQQKLKSESDTETYPPLSPKSWGTHRERTNLFKVRHLSQCPDYTQLLQSGEAEITSPSPSHPA